MFLFGLILGLFLGAVTMGVIVSMLSDEDTRK